MANKAQSNFRNERSSSYLAIDIAKSINRGSAIEKQIETVLNSLRETTGAKNLYQLNDAKIQAYIDDLKERLEYGELSSKTTATYVSALNDVIKYANTLTGAKIKTISAKEVELNRGKREFNNRAVSIETHKVFLDFLSQKNDIKAKALAHSVELQRQFGIRLRESLAIKESTISKALQTNELKLTRNDGTKNAQERTIPITKESQIKALESALSFMQEYNLKSLIPTEKLLTQYYFAQDVKQEFNQISNENNKMDFHGERYFYAQERYFKDHIDLSQISKELGHYREEITKVYLNIK